MVGGSLGGGARVEAGRVVGGNLGGRPKVEADQVEGKI